MEFRGTGAPTVERTGDASVGLQRVADYCSQLPADQPVWALSSSTCHQR
jgi:hypothetical protein